MLIEYIVSAGFLVLIATEKIFEITGLFAEETTMMIFIPVIVFTWVWLSAVINLILIAIFRTIRFSIAIIRRL